MSNRHLLIETLFVSSVVLGFLGVLTVILGLAVGAGAGVPAATPFFVVGAGLVVVGGIANLSGYVMSRKRPH